MAKYWKHNLTIWSHCDSGRSYITRIFLTRCSWRVIDLFIAQKLATTARLISIRRPIFELILPLRKEAITDKRESVRNKTYLFKNGPFPASYSLLFSIHLTVKCTIPSSFMETGNSRQHRIRLKQNYTFKNGPFPASFTLFFYFQ